MEWFKSPFAKYFPDEDTVLTKEETESTVVALKRVLAPFTLRREAKTFQRKREEFLIWAPLSPWQEVLCDTVREKEVERWAGTFGINPMNGLCQRAFLRCFSFRLSGASGGLRDGRCFAPCDRIS